MNGLIGQTPHLPHTPLVPGGGLGTFTTITQPSYTDTRLVSLKDWVFFKKIWYSLRHENHLGDFGLVPLSTQPTSHGGYYEENTIGG